MPVLAVGGITAETVTQLATGGAGFAAIGWFADGRGPASRGTRVREGMTMESGFATPLLEMFKRGEVAPDVKMLAAQGALAPRAHEQLGLLALLVRDPDPEIAGTAEKTLQAIPRDAVAAFLARSEASTELKTFFAARGIEPAAAGSDSDAPLIDTSPKTDEVEDEKDDEGTALQRLASMNVPQKVQRATKGSREERVDSDPRSQQDDRHGRAEQSEADRQRDRRLRAGGERGRGLPADHRHDARVDEELQRGGGADQEPEDAGGDLDESAVPAD